MEKQFIRGLYYNDPHPNAPEFVLSSISIHKDQFKEWLDAQEPNEKGYIKIDAKRSKEGKPYCELNTYKGGMEVPR